MFGARLFYNGIIILSLATFFYYDNDLRKSILSFDILYFGPYFALLGISYYLFYITGDNPGYIDLPTNTEGQHIELSVAQEGSESLLATDTAPSSTVGLVIDHFNHKNEESKKNTEQIASGKSNKTSTGDPSAPELWFCDKCNITQPYRTKHCDQCERCIRKFDHHCFWIGGCVGELNHRKFWLFLFFQTLLELWSYLIADSGLDASYETGARNVKEGTTTSKSPYATSEYGAFMSVTVVLFGLFVFTFVLFVLHTFLILTNQSTWELSKKDRISYLKIYPSGFYPFSQGLIGNIKLIFFHGNKPREWELPALEHRRRKRGFNWCENQYWSCC